MTIALALLGFAGLQVLAWLLLLRCAPKKPAPPMSPELERLWRMNPKTKEQKAAYIKAYMQTLDGLPDDLKPDDE